MERRMALAVARGNRVRQMKTALQNGLENEKRGGLDRLKSHGKSRAYESAKQTRRLKSNHEAAQKFSITHCLFAHTMAQTSQT